jgi:hypothetical protein
VEVDVEVGVEVGGELGVGVLVAVAVGLAVGVAVGVAEAVGRTATALVERTTGCTSNATTVSVGVGSSARLLLCEKAITATSKTTMRKKKVRDVDLVIRLFCIYLGHGGILSTCPGLTTGISQLISLILATFSAYVLSSGATSTLSEGHFPTQ